jgi:hypothetical protein
MPKPGQSFGTPNFFKPSLLLAEKKGLLTRYQIAKEQTQPESHRRPHWERPMTDRPKAIVPFCPGLSTRPRRNF